MLGEFLIGQFDFKFVEDFRAQCIVYLLRCRNGAVKNIFDDKFRIFIGSQIVFFQAFYQLLKN
jgi:hypothetical protein